MKSYLTSIPMRIYRYAKRTPDKTAVIDSDFKTYSYRTLNAISDSIKDLFPVKSPKRVGITMHSGINQIAAILAVVKSGAAYVAFDTALNGTALRRLATEANPDFIITDRMNAMRTGDIPSLVLPEEIAINDSPGFEPIILDSKSETCIMPTFDGKLKPVLSKSIRKQAKSLCDEYGITSNDVVLQSAPVSSPMFLAEMFATMRKGATLAILPEKNRAYADAITDFADRAGVTIICASRSMAEDIDQVKHKPSKLRLMFSPNNLLIRSIRKDCHI